MPTQLPLPHIQSAYNLPDILEIELLPSHHLMPTYLITTPQGNFHLKQYPHHTPEHINQVHNFKRHLVSHHVPIRLPHKTQDGQTFTTNQDHVFALFPTPTGQTLHPDQHTPASLINTAHTLARLHLHSAGEPLTSTHFQHREPDDFIEQAADLIRHIQLKPFADPFDELAQQSLYQKIANIQKLSFNPYYISLINDHNLHGDLSSSNIFYSPDGQISQITNLERSKYGPRVIDVLKAIDQLCFNHQFNALNYLKAKIFLQAYHSFYPLTSEELDDGLLAYYLRALTSLAIEGQHYHQHQTQYDHLLESRMASLAYMAKNLAPIRSTFHRYLHTT